MGSLALKIGVQLLRTTGQGGSRAPLCSGELPDGSSSLRSSSTPSGWMASTGVHFRKMKVPGAKE